MSYLDKYFCIDLNDNCAQNKYKKKIPTESSWHDLGQLAWAQSQLEESVREAVGGICELEEGTLLWFSTQSCSFVCQV